MPGPDPRRYTAAMNFPALPLLFVLLILAAAPARADEAVLRIGYLTQEVEPPP